METLTRNWDLFCSKLDKVKQTRNGIEALCPSHDDKNPSLTASCNDEKILVTCHAGCTFDQISSAIGMEQSKFFASKDMYTPKKIVATFPYTDKEDNLVYNIVRFEPKDFRPQRADGRWTLEEVEKVPYRLPQMLAAIKEGKDILILEG